MKPSASSFQPPFPHRGLRPVARTAVGANPGANPGANATSMRWAALGDAGTVVAAMARVPGEPADRHLRNFPVLIRDCADWRRELAENAVADLAAVMEPGLAALLALNARGADPSAAARALWHEFQHARAAIVALLPPSGELGPRRSA